MTALVKNIIRLWIALASLAAFALGWIGIAQADQSSGSSTTSSSEVSGTGSVELAPLPSLEDLTNQSRSQNPVPVSSFSFSAPRLRTMGS